jgi:transposase-like protein
MLYNMSNIYLYMGERGPKSKFTDIACPNKACQDHGVAGCGNIIGNGTYQARNTTVRRYICHSCGKAFCDSTNTFYYNLRKDESTIDLALNISMKGMSNESTAEVLRIQPATLKRWLALAANQCDKVNATLMKNLNVSRIEMDELWVIVKKNCSKNGSL